MPCHRFTTTDGGVGFLCTRGSTAGPPRPRMLHYQDPREKGEHPICHTPYRTEPKLTERPSEVSCKTCLRRMATLWARFPQLWNQAQAKER